VAGVSTIALLERKTSISRDLFSRYWRDVHGVMAARIPGFESYIQHHVTPLLDVGTTNLEPFEGIATVTYSNEADRQGLIESEITQHIHRDEQNVFRRALLYNLGVGERRDLIEPGDEGGTIFFLTIPEGQSYDIASAMHREAGAVAISLHDLTGGDPGGWNDTDVDDGGTGRRFVAVLEVTWFNDKAAVSAIRAIVAASAGEIAAYRTEERYVMVEHGRPTPLGFRGLDAVRTITEAGATNQLDPLVEKAVFGWSN
jgi:EthD domain